MSFAFPKKKVPATFKLGNKEVKFIKIKTWLYKLEDISLTGHLMTF